MIRICEVCGKEIDTKKEMYQLHTVNDLTKGTKEVLGARCEKHLILAAEPYTTTKEEKQDLFVFACVVLVWIGIEITGVI